MRLTRRQGIGDSSPAWSPNGSRIAFVRVEHEGGQIWVTGANGSGTHLLHADRASDASPTWSHDGERIAFVASSRNRSAIEVMSANGGKARVLTSPRKSVWSPVWLTNDAGLAFLGTDSAYGAGNLFVMRPDGTDVHQLTHWPSLAQAQQFAWTGGQTLTGHC